MKLTKFQRRVLTADRIHYSHTSGRHWAYVPAGDMDEGDSFDIRTDTFDKLYSLGLVSFEKRVGAVSQYFTHQPPA